MKVGRSELPLGYTSLKATAPLSFRRAPTTLTGTSGIDAVVVSEDKSWLLQVSWVDAENPV